MAQTSGFDLAPGALFNDRYEVVRPLSVGGMGAVYEAVHLDTRRRRALKLMRPELLSDASARARFKLEAQVAAEIESEHIVEVVDAGIDARTGAPFIVMELLRGEDLGAVLEKRGTLGPEEVVDLLSQAARALDRTHQAGIVHRDLKPENLFLTAREDGSRRVKVLDFGIAKVLEESRHHTHATASIGTPVFMAPEQISGARIGPAADIYALGHIAFALLCGSAYWDVEGVGINVYSLLVKVAAGAREPAVARAASLGVTLPSAFEGWFSRATALDPEARFASAGELVVGLARALGVPEPSLPRPMLHSFAPERAGTSSVGGPTGYGATVPLGAKGARRSWSLFAVAGAAVFVGIGVAAARLLGAGGGETGSLGGTANNPPGAAAGGVVGPGGAGSARVEPGSAGVVGSSPVGSSPVGSSPVAPGGAGASPGSSEPAGAPGASTALPPRVEPAPRGASSPTNSPSSAASGQRPPADAASAKPTNSPSAAPKTPSGATSKEPASNPILTR